MNVQKSSPFLSTLFDLTTLSLSPQNLPFSLLYPLCLSVFFTKAERTSLATKLSQEMFSLTAVSPPKCLDKYKKDTNIPQAQALGSTYQWERRKLLARDHLGSSPRSAAELTCPRLRSNSPFCLSVPIYNMWIIMPLPLQSESLTRNTMQVYGINKLWNKICFTKFLLQLEFSPRPLGGDHFFKPTEPIWHSALWKFVITERNMTI